MRDNRQLLKKVAEIYDWLDLQISNNSNLAGQCNACGRCCDFEGFDHHLFVTPPEVMYLAANLGTALTAETPSTALRAGAESAEKNKNKINGSTLLTIPSLSRERSDNTKNLGVLCELGGKMNRCPYNIDSKCSVYKHRFAGCRIFYCKGDSTTRLADKKDFQSELSESALKKFKSICTEFKIPYRYTDWARTKTRTC